MKLRRLIAATTVAALAASAVAVSASAITINGTIDAGSGMFVCLVADDGNPNALYTDASLASTITKVTLTVSSKSFEDMEDLKDATWFGGGFGFNSGSTGWAQHEWSFMEGKELIWVANEKDETWTLTFDNGAPIFAADDKYCQVWIQSWDKEPFELDIVSFELLNADGVDIRTLDAAPAPEAPAEPETPAEETVEAPVEETVEAPVEETVEIVESAETAEVIESVEAPVETVEAPVDEPAVDTGAATEGDKQSPDTGVEGIAAVAGIVALAGAAVVASRKRK